VERVVSNALVNLAVPLPWDAYVLTSSRRGGPIHLRHGRFQIARLTAQRTPRMTPKNKTAARITRNRAFNLL
jgi:hypothetical protein